MEPSKKRFKDDGKYGRALEEALGVEENNSKKADLVLADGSQWELKTSNGKSNQTLYNKKADSLAPSLGIHCHRDLIERYPATNKLDPNNPSRKCLNTDLKTTGFNKQGWKLAVTSTAILAQHQIDGDVMMWDLEKMRETAVGKLDKKVDVVVDKDGVVQSYKIEEGFNFDQFIAMLKSGKINLSMKLRIDPLKDIPFKDRGMGWRCPPKHLHELYQREVA